MFTLFGVTIANLNLVEAISRLEQLLASGGQHLVVTANPEILLAARQDQTYRDVLQRASLVLADGTGVVLASYLFGQPITSGRGVGVDLVEALVAGSGWQRYSVFLAGSTKVALDKTTQYLSLKYDNINIIGAYSGQQARVYTKQTSEAETATLIQKLNKLRPDVLLLGFGHPKQEMWLANHLPRLPVKIGIGVGGAFDYLGGQVPRAPHWLRGIGLEWAFRLWVEPRRWHRIWQAVVTFPVLVCAERLKQLFHVEQGHKGKY